MGDAGPVMKKLVHLMNSLIPSHLPNSSTSILSSEEARSESGPSRSDESQANYKAETAFGSVELSISGRKVKRSRKEAKYFNDFVNSLQLISSLEEKERKIIRVEQKLAKEPTQEKNERILLLDLLKNWVKKGCKGELSFNGKREYEHDEMLGSSGLSKRKKI